jgi:hypothetical protein
MTKPFDCQGFLVIDHTGTILSASSCSLVPVDAIADIDTDELSDSEISDLRLYGRNVLADAQALDSIAAHLSGREWSPDDLEFIHQVLLSTGRVVEDVNEEAQPALEP